MAQYQFFFQVWSIEKGLGGGVYFSEGFGPLMGHGWGELSQDYKIPQNVRIASQYTN